MKKYLLKPKITDTFSCVFKDKEINIVTENKIYKEIKKELETWVYYGYIKSGYRNSYPSEVVTVIQSIIDKYHTDYKEIYDRSIAIEKAYSEATEEEEPELEEQALAVQQEKNYMYYEQILKDFEDKVVTK